MEPNMMMPKLFKHCSSIHTEHDAQALLKQCPTYGRTQLTNIFGYVELQSHVSNARRGAARFDALADENSRAAAAPRGLQVANHV